MLLAYSFSYLDLPKQCFLFLQNDHITCENYKKNKTITTTSDVVNKI